MMRWFLPLCFCAVIALRFSSVEARELHVNLVHGGDGDVAANVEIRLVAAGSQGGEVDTSCRGLGDCVLSLGRDTVWTVRALAPGYWSRPVSVGQESPSIRLPLWPSGRFTGSLTWPAGSSPPETLKLRFTSARPGNLRAPEGEEPCLLEAEGTGFVCEVPAGYHDLRLRPQGFSSLYFWSQSLGAGQEHDLRALTLTPGSSVAGWVETEDGGSLDETTAVELRPQLVSAHRKHPDIDKLHRLAFKTRPNEKGFFHFSGVSEGLYSLRATQVAYADAEVEGVDVVHGYESRLQDPLVLTSPRELEVHLMPRQATRGGNWRLELIQLRREKNAKVAEGVCDDLGIATFTGLPAGRFVLLVYEDELPRPFYNQEVVLDRPTTFLDIDLPLVKVEGRVLLGDEPLRAVLLFGGSFSPQSAELHSDEQGNFRGYLPRQGRWKVEIQASDPPIASSLRKVEVRRKSGQEVARVTIRLPDLQVEGVVVTEESEPAPRAMILVRPESSQHGTLPFRAEDDGTFQLRGLPEGRLRLYAGTRDRDGDEVVVDLVDGIEPPPVQLVIRSRKPVHGVIRSERGPVPGATVFMRPLNSIMIAPESATSDAQGYFELALPEATTSVHLEVKAPGYALLVERRQVPEEGLFPIEVDKNWGEIELLFPSDKSDWLQLARGGASTGARSLMSWARLHVNEGTNEPGRTVIPRLAPGGYIACLVEPGSQGWLTMKALGWAHPDEPCHYLHLSPFAKKKLDFTTPQDGR